MNQTGKIATLKPKYLQRLKQEINQNVKWEKQFTRKVAHIGPDYPYSTTVVKGQSWDDFPVIQHLMNKINERLDTNFNSCLLNWYEKGKLVGIGAHKDIEPCLVPDTGVCSVSLGLDSDCEFIFRDSKKQIVKQFTLSEGDIFYFNGADNKAYTHEIPKTRFPNGRVSLTFRQFKD